MAKRPTTTKPPVAPAAPMLIATLVPARLDGLRDSYLAGVAWPPETDEAGKALVVAHLDAFIGHFCEHAGAAGLLASAGAATVEAAELPAAGAIEIVVTGPREGRYRAGRYFTDVASAPFFATPGELARIDSDPKLHVSRTGAVAD
jgi:hypothetical protein